VPTLGIRRTRPVSPPWIHGGTVVAHVLPSIPRMSRIATARPGTGDFEIVIGRGLAFCAHPAIAWRRLPPAGKALLLAAYAGASYISVLTVLLLG
jgi:hypothetical protein